MNLRWYACCAFRLSTRFHPGTHYPTPVRIRVGTPEMLRIVLTRPVVFFYWLLTKTPLPQPHVRSGRHYVNLLPSSPIAASILRKAGYTAACWSGPSDPLDERIGLVPSGE